MWLHDIPQTALAGAVATLGVVILLELRSFKRLRRSVDINLGRVFEQLEMLRAESRQMLEAQAQAQAQLLAQQSTARASALSVPGGRSGGGRMAAQSEMIERPLASPESERPMIEPTAVDFLVAPPIVNPAYENAGALAAQGLEPAQIAACSGLPAGEARLLASLAAARARRDQAAAAAATAEPAEAADSAKG
jgi:hypothetical protein